MESLGVEIVAVKADGDVLVGAPKVVAEAAPKKEEVKADAPAKKEDMVAKKEEGGQGGSKPKAETAGGPGTDNLDIETAGGGYRLFTARRSCTQAGGNRPTASPRFL